MKVDPERLEITIKPHGTLHKNELLHTYSTHLHYVI